MMFSGFWHEVWVAAVVNHLWQSTAVFAVAWLLSIILRGHQARTRYWLWLIASVKFLVPFSLLIAAGERMHAAFARPIHSPALATVMERVTVPFTQLTVSSSELQMLPGGAVGAPIQHVSLLPWMLLATWLIGSLTLLCLWAREWWALRTLVRASTLRTKLNGVPVLTSPTLLEPGVFGILRPVLLLPEGIMDHLSPAQMETIFAHEMSHVRRRDNLAAAIHMVVRAAFWVHPAVWLIGAKMLEEQERACDEAVLQSGNAAHLYAETILKVCRFYVESPMSCVAGVTGADLKERIVRIMAEQVAKKLDLGRKILLGVAGAVAIAVPIVFGLVHVTRVEAQAQAATDLAGTWQGTLQVGKGLRTVIKITKEPSGGYKSVFYSIDQGGQPLPVPTTTFQGSTLKLSIPMIDLTYEGKLSADGKTISGMVTQGKPLPLDLTRATVETAWAIPEPPAKIPPMATGADPSFDVATIKPTKPDEQRTMLIFDGHNFKTVNRPLSFLIAFSYGVHTKQIVGAPEWYDSEKFDITAVPDTPGVPSVPQLRSMVRKLLTDRFKLTFHHDKRDLSVYVLSVAKTGPRMEKNPDPDGLPGYGFRGLGKLHVQKSTMAEYAQMMQESVLDRPVIDQTGLAGRWNFDLKWTPDDSQFGGMGAKVPPPTDAADQPPALFTAIQEQIGLKLEPTKAPTDVLVIDHVEKPSEN